jgi:hypothetical protein
MTGRVFCGTFEAESYWRDPNLAVLPSVRDPAASHIVSAMDEMLFAFCDHDDVLVTARPMNTLHLDYLRSIGFAFAHVSVESDGSTARSAEAVPGQAANIFEKMNSPSVHPRLRSFLPAGSKLEPFAVMPGTAEVARTYSLNGEFPALRIVRAVNTKCYSVKMRDQLGLSQVARVAKGVDAVLTEGLSLLPRGPFLIKDDYGVSGKGNQLVQSEGVLQRVVKYLRRQETQGKEVRFVLEPYLDKSGDCSCQFRIGKEGEIEFFGVQELINDGLAFGVSRTPSVDLLKRLERADYFDVMRRLARVLWSDGYFGDVCIDSMVLKGGDLVPIVEINARRSMSLIKFALDRALGQDNVSGRLVSIPTAFAAKKWFEQLVEELARTSLLFTRRDHYGIVPLTVGTVMLSSDSGNGPVRGRFYAYLIADSDKVHGELLATLHRLVNSKADGSQAQEET